MIGESMCIMCHLADFPIAKERTESWLNYYNTYPMGMAAGVILPYNGVGNMCQYTPGYDADCVMDMHYYGLPGDEDNTNMPTF